MPFSAFIIRPFGKKEVPSGVVETTNEEGHRVRIAQLTEINFDEIHHKLIAPALAQLRIAANTTEVILSAGNIREDMFHLLMTADLVVADVTMHNPNVFYELGIRHAFRDKFTFLIRSNMSDYPFDLKTDRYFEYDHRDPSGSVVPLAEAIKATLNSERADSPVFRLLPRMRAEDRSRFISVPREFQEELERARKYRRGGDLRLLAAECEGFLWEVEGLREVGRAQFELNYIGGACATWEQIARRYPDDVEANMILSTVYQRLNDGTRSEQALARVARLNVVDTNTSAELQSLMGRNLRTRWLLAWRDLKSTSEKQKRALRSPFLRRAQEAFAESFRGNLNYVYSGLNALALLLTEISLGMRFPDEWHFVSDRRHEIDKLREEAKQLTVVIAYAIECEHQRLQHERRVDFWFESLRATFLALTSDNPGKVEQAYIEATAWAPRYSEEAMRRGLEMYKQLEVKHFDPAVDVQANVTRALEVIRREEEQRTPHNVLLFAGLRMEPMAQHGRRGEGEGPIRYLPRSAEARARAEIAQVLRDELEKLEKHERSKGRKLIGMAAGSNGADLIFHEVCLELAIDTRMYMALPKDQYIGQYVAEAGPDWVERFHDVYAKIQARKNAAHPDSTLDRDVEDPINVLVDTDELPRWLQSRANYTIGKRNGIWMLQHALVQRHLFGADTEVTLVVLWAPHRALPGGIEKLIEMAEKSGVKVLTINCGEWEELSATPQPTVSRATAAGQV